MLYKNKIWPVITGVLVVVNVSAQESAKPAQENKSATLDKITVTANKMNEDLQKTSTSITVITEQEIKQKGIETVDDLAKVLPNTANGSTYTGVSDWNYRGLNSSVFQGNNPVIIYIDGIAQTNRRTLSVNMKDVERVEILHGPSGTLYGRGAIGGAINIITKRSSNELRAEVSTEIAENNTYNADVHVSGPLVKDVLLGKFSVSRYHTDGELEFVDKSVSSENEDREEKTYYRGELTYFVNDDSTLTLQANHNKNTSGFGYAELVSSSASAINSSTRPSTVDYNTKTIATRINESQLIKYDREFSDMRLESQLSRRESDYKGDFECDYTSTSNVGCFEHAIQENYDAEVRWVSDSSNLKWVAGLYYGTQDKKILDNGYDILGAPLAFSRGKISSDTTALFGQLTYPLSRQFELTAGMRAQTETIETDTSYFSGVSTTFSKGSKDETALLPKLGLSYFIDDNNTLFANYAKGYLSGGYNDFQAVNVSSDEAYFNPQITDSFEFGYKGRGPGFTLTANLFYMDIEDIHTYTVVGATIYQAGNLKGATSYGAEMELLYEFTSSWSLDASLGVVNAKYKNGSVFNGIDASKKTVEKTPDKTALIGVQYETNSWLWRLEAHHRGNTYYDFQNSAELDGYTLWNTRATYNLDDWEFLAYVNNITDEVAVETVFDSSSLSGPNTVLRILNTSRMVGVGATYRF